MADEIIIEMAPEPAPKPFYKTRRGIIILALLGLIIALALFSWWLANGKISSTSARLDTNIFTVGSEFPATLKAISVAPDEMVIQGQPLGIVEMINPVQPRPRESNIDLSSFGNLAGLNGKFESIQQAEKEISARLSQARVEEQRTHTIYQNAVAEHVKTQLAMRSINRVNQFAYNQAAAEELQANGKMITALEVYEKASLLRANLERTLNKIRAAIQNSKVNKVQVTELKPSIQPSPVMAQLVAPVQGRILAINANAGQTINANQPIFLIMPEGPQENADRWLQAWFSVEDKDKIEPGQKVSIKFDNSDLHVNGRVQVIGQEGQVITAIEDTGKSQPKNEQTDSASKVYLPVRISFDNPQEVISLKPGAKASCQIQTRYILNI